MPKEIVGVIFPSFSAGWRLSEEEFMKDIPWIYNLKLRASWGQLGNQMIEGYWPYLTVINQNYNLSYNYGGSLAPGAAVTALVDEDITLGNNFFSRYWSGSGLLKQ